MSKFNNVDYGNPSSCAQINNGRILFLLGLPNNFGGGTLFDISKFGTNGTLVGDSSTRPTWVQNSNSPFYGLGMTASSNQYVNLGNPPRLNISGGSMYTIKVHYKLTTVPGSGTSYQLFTKDSDSGGRAYTVDVQNTTKGVRFYIGGGGGVGENEVNEDTAPVAGDEKIAYCGLDKDGRLRLYVYDVKNKTYFSTFGGPSWTTPTATSDVLVGRRRYSGYEENLDGTIKEASMWNRLLSESEIKQDMQATLAGYRVPNSPINWISSKRYFRAASGGTFSESYGGSCTASGALTRIKTATKALSGSVTGSGTLAKSATVVKTGSLTSTGALTAIKTATKSLAGSVSAGGTIVNQANKSLSGSVTSSGTLTKLVSKLFNGSSTASGALSNLKASLLSVSGSSTANGSLVKLISKALTGSAPSSGSITGQVNKTLSGSVTPSGVLTSLKASLLSVSGSVASSGSFVKAVSIVKAGTSTATGAIVNLVSKPFAGSITASGTLSNLKLTLLSLSGSIAPSGAIAKSVSKYLSGSISAVGSLARAVIRAFSGACTIVGVLTQYLLNALRYPIVKRTVKSHDARFVVGSHDVRPTPRRY